MLKPFVVYQKLQLWCHMMSSPVDDSSASLVQFAIRVPASLSRRLRIHCVQQGVRMRDFITQAIRDKLHRVGPKRGK